MGELPPKPPALRGYFQRSRTVPSGTTTSDENIRTPVVAFGVASPTQPHLNTPFPPAIGGEGAGGEGAIFKGRTQSKKLEKDSV